MHRAVRKQTHVSLLPATRVDSGASDCWLGDGPQASERWPLLAEINCEPVSGTGDREVSQELAGKDPVNLVTFCGIRGGVGTSTMVALLGDALHAQGQRVLMVDLNASDVLRMHFNVPYVDDHGWVRALFPKDWRQQAFRVAPGLCLVPFGRRAVEESGLSHLLRGEGFWLRALADLGQDFDWVLFDCPSLPYRMASALRLRSTLDILVARPDVAAHVLLAQQGLSGPSFLLVNGFDPGKRLECDIMADWHRRYGAHVLPFSVNLDECLNEALACKTTALRYRPDSAPSQTACSLAGWCLERY